MATRSEHDHLRASELTWNGSFYRAANAPDAYWGEIPEEQFTALNRRVDELGDFDRACLEFFETHTRRDLYVYATDVFGRTAWKWLLRDINPAVAIDVGAGFGAISSALGATFQRVYSIEGCRVRCELLAKRRELQRRSDQIIIHADIRELPFENATADLVVCNGVLEWVAVGAEGDPREIQRAFLREVARVLKPDGILYVGIENRYARAYWRGLPDHTGLKYTSLVPRWLAGIMVRHGRGEKQFFAETGRAYRTYTYSLLGYKALLASAGLGSQRYFCAEPSYDIPQTVFPIDASGELLDRFFNVMHGRAFRGWRERFLCTNFFIFAGKSSLAERLSEQPIYFGYFDRVSVAHDVVNRIDLAGVHRSSPRVYGRSLLSRPQVLRDLHAAPIVTAYQSFLHSGSALEHSIDWNRTSDAFRRFIDPILPNDIRARTKDRIARESYGKYHGDLWLGNLLLEEKTGKIVLIDCEPQLFGSKRLDGVDFVMDFFLHGRSRLYPTLGIEELLGYFAIDPSDEELFLVAVIRQIIRYSPVHRSHEMVYLFRKLLRDYARDRASFRRELGLDKLAAR